MVRFALLILLALVAPARADDWPQPAAGASASGDVEVLFTFDDGPHPRTTPLVLDILAKHRIKAVFFLVGDRVREHKTAPQILQRILRDGHVIASHTMSHRNLCNVEEALANTDLDRGRSVIERMVGLPVTWFRAPFGVRCERLEAMLALRGISHFHWDLDPQEWRHNSAKRTVRYVTRMLGRARGRSVLLLHDVKRVTVQALPEILAWIEEENARRAESQQPRIRIIDAPSVAIERLPPGLVGWLDDATADLRGLPKLLAELLPWIPVQPRAASTSPRDH